MKASLKLISIFLIFYSCGSIKPIGTEQKTIDKLINTDLFGNIYTADVNEMVKYDAALDTFAFFNLNKISRVSSFDVSNPQQIVVFSEFAQKIWILDQTLSVIKELTLDQLDFGIISAVSRTRDNNLFFLAKDLKRLIKVDDNAKELFRSDILWNFDFSGKVESFLQKDNKVFIKEKAVPNVLLFDEYGNFIQVLNGIDTDYRISVVEKYLIYIDKNRNVIRVNSNDAFEDPVKIGSIEAPFYDASITEKSIVYLTMEGIKLLEF